MSQHWGQVLCAWCGADLGHKWLAGDTGESHGMCKACFGKQVWRLERRSMPTIYRANREPLDVYSAMGALANALQARRSWSEDAVTARLDGLSERCRTRRALEVEVCWLAYEEGLLDCLTTAQEEAYRVNLSMATVA